MRELSYREAVSEALWQALEADPAVFLLGEDIGAYGGVYRVTDGFLDHFGPERVIDTPISENAIIGACTGAALAGMRPVAEIQFADFLVCGLEALVNMAATMFYRLGQPVPMVVRAPAGATWAGAGPFHSQSVEASLAQAPGVKVVVPATPADAKGLLAAAIADPNPVVVLEQKYLYNRLRGHVPPGRHVVPIGVAEVSRPGRDATVVAWGTMARMSLLAAERLAAAGAEVEVVDLRSIMPWDEAAVLASVRRTGRALIVHEAHGTAGFGAEVAAVIAERAFAHLDAPVTRLTGLDTPVPAHPVLEAAYLPDEDRIAAALEELLAY